MAAAAPAEGGQADTIQPYTGGIGPDNSLYGLKLAFEDLDESFTFNQSERLQKQIRHADLRLAELKRELSENKTDTADIALEHYRLKINQTDNILESVPVNGTGPAPEIDETGLLNAREMIAKHQRVLGDLIQSHPNTTGLERAYNNSVRLEQKFENKIQNIRTVQQQARKNQSINIDLQDNQTLQAPGPADENALKDRNKFTGNTTQNKDRNELRINQSPGDMNRQQADRATGREQPGQNGQLTNTGNNKDAAGGNQQITPDQTRNIRTNNNNPGPAETGNKNANGNGNGNTRPAGR
ncbi:DUF5667 domain-containing protein [Methanoregula sp.]|uniref:DUF5667 domain-containing protein n=1 Tax=Methanoregula sp. TaxID=2052170 RepID=UPI00260BB750|nr:DUF5667 domain-containing protein [Methanoregula sp.]MDD5144108.1 DUF5667 domain-containing protein [Methanoregula sp.]